MKILALMLSGLLLAAPVEATDDAPIANMMQTPASAFDLFLFRVYEAGKCNNVVSNDNADEADLCLTSLEYDAEQNLLKAFFRVLPAAESMGDFVEAEAAQRKSILLGLLDSTARRFGAVDGWGLLHSIPLGHGIGGDDGRAFRAALARRSTVALSTSWDGKVYIATRRRDGAVEYFTSK